MEPDFFKRLYSGVNLVGCQASHDALGKQIKKLQVERAAVSQRIAEHLCPFEIGDKLVDEQGQKAVVTRITNKYGKRDVYNFYLRKVKTSGELYKNEHEAWYSHTWKKQ